MSKDGRFILVNTYSDTDPGSYYLYDRQKGQAKFLLSAMQWIKPSEMSEMRPISIKSRDGVLLHGYITIPRNSDGRNLPLILHPHGGPHGPRDLWRFDPEVQFLANRATPCCRSIFVAPVATATSSKAWAIGVGARQ